MVDNYKELFQKRKIIRFKLLLFFYHDDEKKKLKTVADEADTIKSEVTKAISSLIEEGLLERDETKTVHLTERGIIVADDYHRRYQLAEFALKRSFDADTAKTYAERIAMQFDADEISTIFSIGAYARKIDNNLSAYLTLDGKHFCELIKDGGFAVPFTIDSVFKPTSQMHKKPDAPSLEEELAAFWHTRSKELSEERKAAGQQKPSNTDGQFENFLKEIITKMKQIFFKKYLEYKEEKNISMADEGFLHPAYCQITDGKGYIKLHRIMIKKTGMRGSTLNCKAEFLKYFDGKEFIDCPFVGDDVEIPMDHFKFTRYGDCLIGKQLLQFKAECDVRDMPVSMAEIVVVFYPI